MDLGRQVERICAQTGYDQVFVVGHSLGGVIARYYVQCRGGDERVHTLVTLGSPHAGTQLARLAPLVKVCRQLRPGSDVMTELAQPGPAAGPGSWPSTPTGTRWCCRTAAPGSNIRTWPSPALPVHGVGHLALLVNGTVVHAVANALADRGEPSDPTPAIRSCRPERASDRDFPVRYRLNLVEPAHELASAAKP